MPEDYSKQDKTASGFFNAAAEPELSPSAEKVRSQLQRILESREFRNSKRSQQFLRHVVDCALQGDVQALKETTIGSVLFGRKPGYDTGSDPSVRVRANDVRKRLLAYYQGAGMGDRVQIELSAGSYMPRFRHSQLIPASRTETGQQLTARPFVLMRDANLDQLERLAASLHVRDIGPLTHRNKSDTASAEFLCPLLTHLAEAMEGDRVYAGALTTDDVITLARAGYQVVEAKDGRDASTKAQEQPFDLLITDLVMPEREGIELIQKLRKEQPELKIIAVSGAFGGTFLKVAQALGANATLAKPVSPDELLATAESLLT